MGQAEENDEDRLRSAIEAYHASALAYGAVKLGLPEKMGARPWTAGALAAQLGLSPPHLLRFLRGLVILGICEERPDGNFVLTALGQTLKPGSPSRLGEKVTIVVEQYWQPWADLVSTLQTGAPSFDHVFGTDVWAWRNENFRSGDMFAAYLAGETFAPAGPILERWISRASSRSPISAAATADCLPRSFRRIPACEASCSTCQRPSSAPRSF